MKKIILSLVTVFFVSMSISFAQTADEAIAKFKSGSEKAQNKQFAEAAADCEEALSIAKQVEGQEELVSAISQLLSQSYLYQGVTAIKTKNYAGGIEALNKAKKIATENKVASVQKQAARYLSLAFQTQGSESFNAKDYKSALESFNKGYQEDPTNVKLANLTAKSYAELGDLKSAAAIYSKTIADNSANAKYATEVAAAKADIEQYALIEGSKLATAKNYDGLVDLADNVVPGSEGLQLLTVQLANSMKKYDAVISRAEKAASVQTDPAKKSEIYLMLGAAYQNKDNKAKAIEALKKVVAGNSVAQAKSLIAELSK